VVERGPVSPGDEVLVGDAEVGTVTSATRSPLMGASIALAYVSRDYATPATNLLVKTADGATPATVTALPFTLR
jgi:aminomethyltransferase